MQVLIAMRCFTNIGEGVRGILSAHQGVEHDDMNILCLGARVIGIELAGELATAFLNARFSDQERHRRRLSKVLAIEQVSR